MIFRSENEILNFQNDVGDRERETGRAQDWRRLVKIYPSPGECQRKLTFQRS